MSLRKRLTARVLLFDPHDRLLLMKGRASARPSGRAAWFTIGGGADPGETVEAAAAREIAEETGFSEFELGQVIWRREGEFRLVDGPVWMDEHYFVARCAGGDPVRHGWQADEHALIDDIRWWTHAELLTTTEPVFPPDLPALLHDVLAGRLPAEPLSIRW